MRFNEVTASIGSQIRVTCTDSKVYTGLFTGIDWDIDTPSGVDELCMSLDSGEDLSIPLEDVMSIEECSRNKDVAAD